MKMEEQQTVTVPDGWKLVPMEPTHEMLRSHGTGNGHPAREIWNAAMYRAMLAAAIQEVRS